MKIIKYPFKNFFFLALGSFKIYPKRQKEKNRNLIPNSQRYKQLADLTFEGILLHKKGVILDVNTALCKLLNSTADSLIGENFIDHFVPAAYKKVFEDKILFDHAFPFEIEIQLPNGVILPVEVESVKTQVDDNEISSTAFRNIMARKQAQASIDRVQNKLNLHFELTPLAVIEWDLDMKVVRWNKAATRIFGYTFKEVAGLKANILIPGSKKEHISNIWAHVKGMRNGEPSTTLNVTKEGRLITCNWYNTPLHNEYGTLVGVASMAQDITSYKKTEESLAHERLLLRTLIDNLPDAIYFKDKEGRKLIANKADLENMGLQEEKDVIGKTDFELFPPDVATKFDEIDREVMNNNTSILDREEYLKSTSGRERWIQTSKIPISNNYGTVMGLVGVGRDITQQKKIEKALTQAEKNLKRHIEDTPLAVVEFDMQFKIVGWNKAAEKMYGYKRQEVFEKEGHFIFMKNQSDAFNQTWSELLAQTGGNQITIENIKKSGEIILCKWHNTSLTDADGKLIGVASMIQDITEMKKLEFERERYIKILTNPMDDTSELLFTDLFDLQEMQQLQDQFASATGVASLITDPQGVPITKSSNFCDFCNLVRGTDQGLRNCMHSDSMIGANEEPGIFLQKCLSSGLWDAGTRIVVGGKHIANWLVGQVRDESINSSEIINYLISLGGNEQQASEALGKVNTMSLDRFKKIGEVLHTLGGLLSSIAYQNIQQARSINELNVAKQTEILKNNELRSAEEEVRGANEQLMATNQALHNNMIALEKAKLKAEENERLKTSFLSNMSHEIRTPLNGIIGFTQLLVDPGITPEKQQFFTEIIINSSDQLLAIVTDILDISKIETKQLTLREDTFSVESIFNELEARFIPKAEKIGLDLYVENKLDELNDSLTADKSRLVQILNHLINNALKYTSKGYIRITSELIDNHIQFSVEDTGIGIKKEFQEKVFDRFLQGDTFLNDVPKGTGLGLAICKSLLELMRGEIWIESDLDPWKTPERKELQGTKFIFTLPRVSLDEADALRDMGNSLSRQIPILNILVAEDVDYNYVLIAEYLAETQATIFRANNGVEAVEICTQNPSIDLVLMDIRMPKMNGYEASRKIKALRPNLPIIAQTAFAFDEKKEALDAGCNDLISKPIDKDHLFQVISKYTLQKKH